MNLLDVLPLRAQPATFDPDKVKAAEMTAELLSQLDVIGNREEAKADDKKMFEAVAGRMKLTGFTQRREIAYESEGLPESLRCRDALTWFAESPRVEMSDMRALADAFGFIIIPWNYFVSNPAGTPGKREGYAEDYTKCKLCTSEQGSAYHKKYCGPSTLPSGPPIPPEVQPSVEEFVREAGKSWGSGKFVPHVLCPVTYYSLQRHVVGDVDMPIYPGTYEQAFMGVQMSIPVFRQLSRRVAELEGKASDANARLNVVDAELRNLARRLEEMEAAEERRRREQAALRLAAQAAERAAQEARDRVLALERFIAYDPLMLAVPAGVGALGEGRAVVGPCWGPDFDEVLAVACGYATVAGQRAQLEARRWKG